MRRLPVYLLLDTSGSMKGEPIESLKNGLKVMVSALRQDPFALETVWLSIITFDTKVKQLMPLTDLESFIVPEFQIPDSGATFLGKALEELYYAINRDIIHTTEEQKGDWKPLLLIITDGSPSDISLYREMISLLQNNVFSNIVACAAGSKAKIGYLKEFTTNVYSLDTMDSNTFNSFFKWVSASVASENKGMGLVNSVRLPPPPPEVQPTVI